MRVSYKKKIWQKVKKHNFFASLKSLKKGVGSEDGSGAGSGSVTGSQRYGSGSAPKCHGSPTLVAALDPRSGKNPSRIHWSKRENAKFFYFSDPKCWIWLLVRLQQINLRSNNFDRNGIRKSYLQYFYDSKTPTTIFLKRQKRFLSKMKFSPLDHRVVFSCAIP